MNAHTVRPAPDQRHGYFDVIDAHGIAVASRPTKREATAVAKKLDEQAACDHAWVLNVKPAVCLWCGARKRSR